MWAKSIFEQILNICEMLSTRFVFGLWNPLVCRVVVLESPECRQHRAHSVIIVDMMHCIRRCLRRQHILESNRVCMFLNHNHSADRLGLNPAGLTKWE